MKKAADCISIDEIRECIDTLDKEIIKLISTRFEYVKTIVRFKTDKESIIAQPRYDSVINSRRELAKEAGLNPDVIETMYRSMMDYFIAEELNILNKNK